MGVVRILTWIGGGLLTFIGLLTAAFAVAWYFHPREVQNNRVEHPPAKPPDCPPSKYIASLQQTDGSLADVRVIKVGNTLLFVPAQWLAWYFVDSPDLRPWGRSDRLEKFIPDLHTVECPGQVHELNWRGPTPRYGNNRGSVTFFSLFGNFAPVELKGTGGRTQGFNVDIQAAVDPDGRNKPFPRFRSVGDYWQRPNEDFFILRSGPTRDEDKQKYETELGRLAAWLRTTPNQRDNGNVFFTRQDFP